MTTKKLRILVLTSCAGEKAHNPAEQHPLQDFEAGKEHIQEREWDLQEYMLSAEQMYIGLQHVRLMRGIEAARSSNFEVRKAALCSFFRGLPIPLADATSSPFFRVSLNAGIALTGCFGQHS